MSSQFPIQFAKLPQKRGEPFKMAQHPETPTTDHTEIDWSGLVTVLYAWSWYQGFVRRGW